MDFALTEDQALIRDMARKFADDRLKPHAAEWDETKHFPVEAMREAAELGFAGIYTREDVGGSALSRLDAAIIFEELSDKRGVFPLNGHAIVKDKDEVNYLMNFPLNYHPQYTPSWLDFLLRIKSRLLYHLNTYDSRVSGFGAELKNLDKFCCWKEVYGWDLNFDGGSESVLKKYEWLKDEFNSTINKYSEYLSVHGDKKKHYGGVKEGMKISPIAWNGVIWSPEKELGHIR